MGAPEAGPPGRPAMHPLVAVAGGVSVAGLLGRWPPGDGGGRQPGSAGPRVIPSSLWRGVARVEKTGSGCRTPGPAPPRGMQSVAVHSTPTTQTPTRSGADLKGKRRWPRQTRGASSTGRSLPHPPPHPPPVRASSGREAQGDTLFDLRQGPTLCACKRVPSFGPPSRFSWPRRRLTNQPAAPSFSATHTLVRHCPYQRIVEQKESATTCGSGMDRLWQPSVWLLTNFCLSTQGSRGRLWATAGAGESAGVFFGTPSTSGGRSAIPNESTLLNRTPSSHPPLHTTSGPPWSGALP